MKIIPSTSPKYSMEIDEVMDIIKNNITPQDKYEANNLYEALINWKPNYQKCA